MKEDIVRLIAKRVWSAGDTYIGPSFSSLQEFADAIVAYCETHDDCGGKVTDNQSKRAHGIGGEE